MVHKVQLSVQCRTPSCRSIRLSDVLTCRRRRRRRHHRRCVSTLVWESLYVNAMQHTAHRRAWAAHNAADSPVSPVAGEITCSDFTVCAYTRVCRLYEVSYIMFHLPSYISRDTHKRETHAPERKVGNFLASLSLTVVTWRLSFTGSTRIPYLTLPYTSGKSVVRRVLKVSQPGA